VESISKFDVKLSTAICFFLSSIFNLLDNQARKFDLPGLFGLPEKLEK